MSSALSANAPHLLLVDGTNFIRRCWEANPAPESAAKAEHTMRSAAGSVRRALNVHAPTHALVVLDHGGPNWRHELYEGYKASRSPTPAALTAGIPLFTSDMVSMGLATTAVPGVEADDTMASVARAWLRSGAAAGSVTLLSTDKDMAALVHEGVRVHPHFQDEWHDEAWVQRKFGVPSSLLQDLLALLGDSVDDIPGVVGVGGKTAPRLLLEHGSLEGVLAAAEAGAIAGKLGERLRADGAQAARLSRQLVAFKLDVKVGLTAAQLRWSGWQTPRG